MQMKQFIVFICLFMSVNSQQVLDEILAVVGDEMITKSELEQTLLQMKIQGKMSDAEIAARRPYILKQMVDENLLYIKSQLDSVVVTEEQLEQESDNRWRQLINQVASYGGEQYLERVYNAKARDIRKRQMKRLKRDLAIMQLRSKYINDLRVTREEVYTFFEEYQDSLPVLPERLELANIVVRAKAGGERDAEAYKKAEAAIERLKKGENFAALAKELSEGPSGPKGGALGKVTKGNFVKEFEDAAYSLTAGEYSQEPVKSPFGYHVILLHSKTENEIETSHILFMAQATAEDIENAKAQLDSIRTAIVSGSLSFEDAARKYSEDPSSNEKGGYIGIFPVESIPSDDTKKALEYLKSGEISTIIPLDEDVVQIVKVIKRIPATQYDINRDFTAVESMAKRFKQEHAFEEMVSKLKNTIPVEIY
jgi:peptidyl-prolyl cis-trans isomerase SurA